MCHTRCSFASMITVQTDINRQSLHIHEMGPIRVLVSGEDSSVNVRLHYRDQGPVIIEEKYYPDFSGLVTIDIRDICSRYMYLKLPESLDSDVLQTSLVHEFQLDIGESYTASFFVLGFSSAAENMMTDIDVLRVPYDYIQPLSAPQTVKRSAYGFFCENNRIATMNSGCKSSGTGGPTVNCFVRIPTPERYSRLQAFLSTENNVPLVKGPMLEICKGDFEQYLFANRYGGFDNIPMDGVREFVPEINISSATFNDTSKHLNTEYEYLYIQNTGYQSSKTIEVLSELLGGGQIYHWDSKLSSWRKIVVVDVSINSKNKHNLHSCTFKYKYCNDSRPLTLKGYSDQESSSVLASKQVAISASPQTIVHNLNKYPSVKVIDSDGIEVICEVQHINQQTVVVSWNGDLTGNIFII